MQSIYFLLILFFIFSSAFCEAKALISAQDNKLSYSGRIDFDPDKGAYMTWPGTSVTFRFTGDKLILNLDDDKGQNYYNVIFNKQDRYPYILSTKQGFHHYDLSHKIDSATTEVTIFKRTEGEEGGTYLRGITLADDGKLITPPERKKLKIAFFGDSVTVGMGNESAHNGDDHKPEDKNHYLSYAAIAARSLGAEFHSIAKSGIGFMVSWFDFIMPEYFDQITAESNNDSLWDFNQWRPDIVLVNLGQNDSWLIDREKKLQAKPEQIIRAYQDFITKLRHIYPDAYFICALGSMDATANQTWPNYIKQAVANLKTEAQANGAEANIDTLMFEYTGYGAHPRVDQHEKNADVLTKFIQTKFFQ